MECDGWEVILKKTKMASINLNWLYFCLFLQQTNTVFSLKFITHSVILWFYPHKASSYESALTITQGLSC